MMRVLVACEFSGIVRNAFVRAGHDAISCDILPSETERPDGRDGHYQGTYQELLAEMQEGRYEFDLMIAHPPCTRLCNSGVRWLHERNLWAELDEAAAFFKLLLDAPVPRIAVENPIMHKYALERIGVKHTQSIQPWMFGHGETKETRLWLKNLPPLIPTSIVKGRETRVHYASPGPDRWKERSRTYQGIADAMANQWGKLD